MKVLSVKPVGRADVYNMNVEDVHNFIIQGGVIAHNCDAVRYQCMQHIIPPRLIETTQLPMSDPLNQFEKYRNPNRMIRR